MARHKCPECGKEVEVLILRDYEKRNIPCEGITVIVEKRNKNIG